MALVQGEDSESDEEINTDQMHALALTPDGSLTKVQPSPPDVRKSAGIVAGEESETDDEDDEGSMEQTDSGQQVVVVPSNQTRSVSPVGSTRSSLDSSTPAPQSYVCVCVCVWGGGGGGGCVSVCSNDIMHSCSKNNHFLVSLRLLHKKLRETNVSLRRRIVNRILRLYRTICRNLTTVNDNLSKAQGTVEVGVVCMLVHNTRTCSVCIYTTQTHTYNTTSLDLP